MGATESDAPWEVGLNQNIFLQVGYVPQVISHDKNLEKKQPAATQGILPSALLTSSTHSL